MAKITGLTALGAAPSGADLFPVVDVSDTTQSANGSTKNVTMANVIDAVEANANTFTAAQTIQTSAASGLTIVRSGNNPSITFSDGTNTPALIYRSGIGLGPSGAPFIPQVDDSLDLGTINFRWDDIFATNATIQTSDANLKIDIEDSDIGWDFIRALRPVRYRWADKVVIDEETGDERVVPGGLRPHYGLIAQDVKAVMDAQGIEDFAGYIYDAESGRHGLRYGELWAPLIAAIKQGADIIEAQAAQIEALTARVEALEGGQ